MLLKLQVYSLITAGMTSSSKGRGWRRRRRRKKKTEEEMMTKLSRKKENKWNFKMCSIVNHNRLYTWSIFFSFFAGSVTVESHTWSQHKIHFWLWGKSFKAIGPDPRDAWTKVRQFASSILSSSGMPVSAGEAQPGCLLITSLQCQAWGSKCGQCNYSRSPSVILHKSHGYGCHCGTVVFDNTCERVQTHNG